MPDLLHQELIRQAVAAAKAGDRETALNNLREVLEEDDENVRAWLLLARLSPDKEESRLALSAVLKLDPDNQKARELKDKLEGKTGPAPGEEFIPGVTKRQAGIAGGVVAAVVVILLLIFLVLQLTQKNKEEDEQRRLEQQHATQTAFVVLETQAAQATAVAIVAATQTEIALVSPTPTGRPTSSAPTLPPTLTPTPDTSNVGPEALPPPSGLTGVISGWSGIDMSNTDALPQVIYTLTGEAERVEPQAIGSENGQDGYISPDGTRMIYSRFIQRGTWYDLELMDLEGAEIPSNLDQAPALGAYNGSFNPAFSDDGGLIVFIGEALNTDTEEVYVIDLNAPPQTAPVALTSDTSNYSYPAFSPDGTKVVAVRVNPASETNPGPDLVIIDVVSHTYVALTTDNDKTVETMPDWSPDGSLIVYAAASPQVNPSEYDLYVIAPDNPGEGRLIVDDPTNAIHPVYSPDGLYLAFSSDRSGYYDIYIYDIVGQQTFQLTDTHDEDYPANWIALPSGEESDTEG